MTRNELPAVLGAELRALLAAVDAIEAEAREVRRNADEATKRHRRAFYVLNLAAVLLTSQRIAIDALRRGPRRPRRVVRVVASRGEPRAVDRRPRSLALAAHHAVVHGARSRRTARAQAHPRSVVAPTTKRPAYLATGGARGGSERRPTMTSRRADDARWRARRQPSCARMISHNAAAPFAYPSLCHTTSTQ